MKIPGSIVHKFEPHGFSYIEEWYTGHVVEKIANLMDSILDKFKDVSDLQYASEEELKTITAILKAIILRNKHVTDAKCSAHDLCSFRAPTPIGKTFMIRFVVKGKEYITLSDIIYKNTETND